MARFLSGAVLVAALLWLIWLAPSEETATSFDAPQSAGLSATAVSKRDRSDPVKVSATRPARPTARVRRASAKGEVISSWVDVDADGTIQFDEKGRLRVDRNLRRRFDFILTGLGEVPPDRLRAEFGRQLEAAYTPEQVAQILSEFDRYVDYLRSADALMSSTAPDLRSRFEAVTALQRDFLGPERSEAWFGEDNAYLERTLDVMEGRIEGGDEAQDPYAAELQAATAHHMAVEMADQYERLGIEPAQRHVEREALYGTEAADRLAALDAERAAWETRVRAYAQERARLEAMLGLGEAERQAALGAWIDGEFSEAEQRRLIALERNGLLEGPP